MSAATMNPVAAAAAQAAASFAFVSPLEVTLTVRDQTVVVTPLTVGEVGPFARAITPLMEYLPSIVAQQANAEAVMHVLSQHTEDALQAVAVPARVPLELIKQLRLDELVELATVVLEVNADFFKRALPGLQRNGARLMATFSAGPPPSNS